MKTILVLSAHPDFPETVRAGLNPELYRIVHRIGVEEADFLQKALFNGELWQKLIAGG